MNSQMPLNDLTQAQVKAVLNYDPETGIFTWNPRPRVMGGKIAGNLSPVGYMRIGLGGRGVNKRLYQSHRLAWLYMTGEWPANDIDHINGCRTDNRWVNLRSVDRRTNLENLRVARSNNRSGLLGVSMARKRFNARIYVNGRVVNLGNFDLKEQAHAAYVAAKRVHHSGCTI